MPLGPLMGAKVVYRVILEPAFRVIGPVIKKFSEKYADQTIELRNEFKMNMKDITN